MPKQITHFVDCNDDPEGTYYVYRIESDDESPTRRTVLYDGIPTRLQASQLKAVLNLFSPFETSPADRATIRRIREGGRA